MNALFTAPREFDLAKNVRNYLHFDCTDTCWVSRRASGGVSFSCKNMSLSFFFAPCKEKGVAEKRKGEEETSDLSVCNVENITIEEMLIRAVPFFFSL